MPNDLIDEKNVPSNWVPADAPAVIPGKTSAPAPVAHDMPQYFSGSLPPALQHDTSFVSTEVASPRIPTTSLMPLGNQASPFTNAAAQSTATLVSVQTTVSKAENDVESVAVNKQTGTTYTALLSDRNTLISMSNNAGGVVTLPGGPTTVNPLFNTSTASGSLSVTVNLGLTPLRDSWVMIDTTVTGGFPLGTIPLPPGFTSFPGSAVNNTHVDGYGVFPAGTAISTSCTQAFSLPNPAVGSGILFSQATNGSTPVVTGVATTGALGSTSAVSSSAIVAGTSLVVIIHGQIYPPGTGQTATSFTDTNGNVYELVSGISTYNGTYGSMNWVFLCRKANANSGGNNVTYSFLPTPTGASVSFYIYQVTNLLFTIPAAPPFPSGWFTYVENTGTGRFLIASGVNIDGSSQTVSLGPNQGSMIVFDGLTWFTERGVTPTFYQSVQQAGVSQPTESSLNFLAPITTTDNPGNKSTDIAVPVFIGDSGSGGVKGLVPAPAAGDAAANKFLKSDGTFSVVATALPIVMKVNGTGVAADKQIFVNGITDVATVWGVKINGTSDGG